MNTRHTHNQTRPCPSLWERDRWNLGLLSRAEAALISAHVDSCPSCRERQSEEKEDLDWLDAHLDIDSLLPQRNEETSQTAPVSSWWSQWLWASPVLASACCLLIAWLVQEKHPISPISPTQRQTSGLPFPGAIAKNAFSARMLHLPPGSKHSLWTKRGQRLLPGTIIQFEIDLSKAGHIMVLSLNQHGAISAYIPLGGHHSISVQPGKHSLPQRHSLELDDSMATERIFIAFSHKPFTKDAFQRAIQKAFRASRKQLEPLHTLPGWHIATFLFHKRKL